MESEDAFGRGRGLLSLQMCSKSELGLQGFDGSPPPQIPEEDGLHGFVDTNSRDLGTGASFPYLGLLITRSMSLPLQTVITIAYN